MSSSETNVSVNTAPLQFEHGVPCRHDEYRSVAGSSARGSGATAVIKCDILPFFQKILGRSRDQKSTSSLSLVFTELGYGTPGDTHQFWPSGENACADVSVPLHESFTTAGSLPKAWNSR